MAETGTMQIVVNGRHLEVTPALREHAERKVSKLERYFPDARGPIVAQVLLSVEKGVEIAEVTLQVQDLYVRAQSRTADMYASIDRCVERIERQVRKHKTKIQRRFQSGKKLGAAQGAPAPAQEAGAEAEEAVGKVVKTKRFTVKPMDVEEAILQMELLDHSFFVFANAETEQVNVLYRRADGDYGLIEPDVE